MTTHHWTHPDPDTYQLTGHDICLRRDCPDDPNSWYLEHPSIAPTPLGRWVTLDHAEAMIAELGLLL